MSDADGLSKNLVEIQANVSAAKEYERLLRDPADLQLALRGRLVAIAFGSGGSAQCRAIEALLGMPAPLPDDDVSDNEQDRLENAAIEYLSARGFEVKKRPFTVGAAES